MSRFTGLFPLVLLAGCLGGPDTSDACFQYRQLVWDVCDVETTADEEDDALAECQYESGYAMATGCASELKAALKCIDEASQGVDCEDLAFVASEECAFEQGRYEGCLAND